MPERSAVQTAAKRVQHSPAPVPVKAGAKGVSMVSGKLPAKTRPKPQTAPARSTGATRAVDTDRSDSAQYRNATGSNSSRARGRGRNRRASSSSPNPKIGALMAEWLFGVVAISITVPLNGGQNGYGKTLTEVFYRLTGLTGFFFVLALLGNSARAAKFVVWFGLLVDLGIVFTAATGGTFGAVANVMNGKPAQSGTASGGGILPAADVTSSNEPPSTIANAVAPIGAGSPTFGGNAAGSNNNPAVPA